MKNSRELSFSVDGQLIGELGQRLVTRNHVALAELIKNSYDADATNIHVQFTTLEAPNGDLLPGIYIIDDGLGMSMENIENNWMRIATSHKQKETLSSKFGRPRTGSKGIGRFSCERLARYLHLKTTFKQNGRLETIEAVFDWDKFTPGRNLADIKITFRSEDLNSGDCGTTLKLIGLRDHWTQSQYDTLTRAVMTLTVASAAKRDGYAPDPGFNIILKSDTHKKNEQNLFKRLINSGWGRIKAKISNDGEITATLQGKYLDKPQYYNFPKKYKSLAGVHFDIGFLRDGEGYELNRDTSILTKKLLNEFRKQAGVRVYYENFRVYPYGETGNDWLSLDHDYARRASGINDPALKCLAEKMQLSSREVGLLKPRNANLLGSVHLNKKSASNITTKMSREGFIDSPTFSDLVSIIRTSIEWASIHYAYARLKHLKTKRHEVEKNFLKIIDADSAQKKSGEDEEALPAAIDLLTKYASSSLPENDAEPISLTTKIESAKSVITANLTEKDEEIARLRILASTAPLLFTFTHEVYSLINLLDTQANDIKIINSKTTDKSIQSLLKQTAKDLQSAADNFRSVAKLFGLLNTPKDTSAKRHYIYPLLSEMVNGTAFALQESSISVNIDCDSDIKTPKMNRSEFVSIIINLYVNSLKSTMAAKGKKINIRCYYLDDNLIIEFLDKGVGLNKSNRSIVFEPFVSDPENKIYSQLITDTKHQLLTPIAQGSGLGLSIIKGIIESRNGNVEFFDAKSWSIGIRVTLPR